MAVPASLVRSSSRRRRRSDNNWRPPATSSLQRLVNGDNDFDIDRLFERGLRYLLAGIATSLSRLTISPVRRITCQRSRCPYSAVARRLDDHQVHQLPVDELLERQHPQHPQPLAVEPQRVRGGDQLEREEPEPDEGDLPGSGEERGPYRATMSTTGASSGSTIWNSVQVGQPAAAELPPAPTRRTACGASTSPGGCRSTSGSADATAAAGWWAPRSRRARPS